MRMWLMAMGVAMIGFNAMVALGWVQAGQSVYAGPRLVWLSNALSGLLFGFGMVLASGCGSKTLVRIGGGSLKSVVVFFVLAVANSQAEMKDPRGARKTIEDLMKAYPQSEAAQAGKERLAALK